MKVYLVIERENDSETNDCIFGVFTDKLKAEHIRDEISANFAEHNEDITIVVEELTLDETTEDYDFFMYN